MKLISNKDQQEIIDRFVVDLGKSLEVEEERVSFNTIWDASPPLEAKGQSLEEFMKDVNLPPKNTMALC